MSYTAPTAIYTQTQTKPYSLNRTISTDRTHWISRFTTAVAGAGGCAGHPSDGARHIVICEVLPQQQSLLVFLPCQTVTVVVNFECLTPGNKGVIWAISVQDKERIRREGRKKRRRGRTSITATRFNKTNMQRRSKKDGKERFYGKQKQSRKL